MNTYTILYNIHKSGIPALFGREYTVDADSEQEAISKLHNAKNTIWDVKNEIQMEIEDVMQHDVEEA